jgi:hypothetical protein
MSGFKTNIDPMSSTKKTINRAGIQIKNEPKSACFGNQ